MKGKAVSEEIENMAACSKADDSSLPEVVAGNTRVSNRRRDLLIATIALITIVVSFGGITYFATLTLSNANELITVSTVEYFAGSDTFHTFDTLHGFPIASVDDINAFLEFESNFEIVHRLDAQPNLLELVEFNWEILADSSHNEITTSREIMDILVGEFASRYIFFYTAEGNSACSCCPKHYIFNEDNTFVFFYPFASGEIFAQGIFTAQEIEYKYLEIVTGDWRWESMLLGQADTRSETAWYEIVLEQNFGDQVSYNSMFLSIDDSETVLYLPESGITAVVDKIR